MTTKVVIRKSKEYPGEFKTTVNGTEYRIKTRRMNRGTNGYAGMSIGTAGNGFFGYIKDFYTMEEVREYLKNI